jgi:hypothetical protein
MPPGTATELAEHHQLTASTVGLHLVIDVKVDLSLVATSMSMPSWIKS